MPPVNEAAVAEGLVAHPRRWLILAVVCAAQFLCILDLWVVKRCPPWSRFGACRAWRRRS